MFAVIRIRGVSNVRKDISDTLKMLRLDAPNNCVLLPENEDYKGMVQKARGVITWGEIEKGILAAMLQKRIRLGGGKRIDEKSLKQITGFDSFEKFAEALISGKARIKDFEQIRPVFRLTPPSKGFKSVKDFYPSGDLGYRGKEINELLERMI